MRYRRADDVTWEQAGERVVILDAPGSALVTLNPVGSVLWHDVAQPRTADELADALTERFPDVEPTRLRADVDAYLANMTAEGLVVEDAADGG